jgi:hypothetical protein
MMQALRSSIVMEFISRNMVSAVLKFLHRTAEYRFAVREASWTGPQRLPGQERRRGKACRMQRICNKPNFQFFHI